MLRLPRALVRLSAFRQQTAKRMHIDELRAFFSRITVLDYQRHFDSETIKKGQRLQRALSVELTQVSDSNDAHAKVLSSNGLRWYDVEVQFLPNKKLVTLCSCPMEFDCKHCAAVVLELSLLQALAQADPNCLEAFSSMGKIGQRVMEAGLLKSPPIVISQPPKPNQAVANRNWLACENWLRTLPDATGEPAVHKPDPKDRHAVLFSLYGGALFADLVRQRIKKDGDFGKPYLVQPYRFFELEPDFQPAAMCLSAIRAGAPYNRQAELNRQAGEKFMAVASGLPWLFGPDATPMQAGAPRLVEVLWQRDAQDHWNLRIETHVAHEQLFATIERVWYIDEVEGVMGPITGMNASQWLAIRTAPPVHQDNRERLAAKLGQLKLPLPTLSARPQRQAIAPSGAVLRVEPHKRPRKSPCFFGKLLFLYDGTEIDEDAPSIVVAQKGDHDLRITRDPAAESEIQNRVRACGLKLVNQCGGLFLDFAWNALEKAYCADAAKPDDPLAWLALSPALQRAGIALDMDPTLGQMRSDPSQYFVEANETEDGGNAWFDVDLGIEIDGQRVSLVPILAQALVQKRFSLTPAADEPEYASLFIRLSDTEGVHCSLAKLRDLLRPIAEWLSESEFRVPKLRAAMLGEIDESQYQVRASATLRALAQACKTAHQRAPTLPPAALQAQLRPYQQQGLDWLGFLGEQQLGGILADDMGLGKTVQVVAHLLAEREAGRLRGPTLVVMPTSLIPNWRAELQRFAPTLSVLVWHGLGREQLTPQLAQTDVLLTTYTLLHLDIDRLRSMRFDLVIFDEAQAIKNPKAKAAAAARQLNTQRRLVMTGTPLENHLGELWAQVDLVLPGLLGPSKSFTALFRNPIEKHGDRDRHAELERRLRPFLLRRKKSDVLKDLPPKTEILRKVGLEGGQRELYESLRVSLNEKVQKSLSELGLARSSIVILDALLKLRQVCCDPRLVKLPSASKVQHSAKLDMLFEMLSELVDEGRRILLFSQFTQMLDLIEPRLLEAGTRFVRLDGSTRDRQTPVEQFQAGDVPVFLISLKAGGSGLNLTAADTVIHYDPWWNPAVENQATDRAHRIGQAQNVFVYRLVCEDTVEEKIISLGAKKADLAKAILDGGSSTELRFDEEAVRYLFGADSP